MADPLAFALATLALLAAPGPTNLLLMSAGALAGSRAALRLLAVALLAYLLAIPAIGLVFVPATQSLPRVRDGLFLLAAGYLLWLALRLWPGDLRVRTEIVTPRAVFVTTLLNPKVLLLATVIIPLQRPDRLAYLAGFAALMLCAGAAWVALGAAAGRATRDRDLHIVPRVAAMVLAGLAVALLVMRFAPLRR